MKKYYFKLILFVIILSLLANSLIFNSNNIKEHSEEHIIDFDNLSRNLRSSSISFNQLEVINIESNGSSSGVESDIDIFGNIHLIWRDSYNYSASGDDIDIFYKKWDNVTKLWSDIELISANSTNDSSLPSLNVDRFGNIHIAWEDKTDLLSSGADYDIFYRRWDIISGNWTQTELVSSGMDKNSRNPKITNDLEGNVHITWYDYNISDYNPNIYYRSWENSTTSWTNVERISIECTGIAQNPSIATDNNGNVHIAWQDTTNYNNSGTDNDIFYKSWNFTTEIWSTLEVVSIECNQSSYRPSIAIDSTNNLHVTWYDHTRYDNCGSDRDIFYKLRNSSTKNWNSVEIISRECNSASINPSITIDELDNIYITWQDLSDYFIAGPDEDIFYKWYNNVSKVWSIINVISIESNTYSQYPTISIKNLEKGCIAWIDLEDYNGCGGDTDIFFKHLIKNKYPKINQPSDIITDGSGSEINWIITDDTEQGKYHVFTNNTIDNHIECSPYYDWYNNSIFNIPINSIKTGVFVYTIEYYDVYYLRGINSSVKVTIIDTDPIFESSQNDFTVYKGRDKVISWTIIDDFGGGDYIIFNDNIPILSFLWSSGVPIPYIVDTSKLGIFNITIQITTNTGQVFWDDVIITISRSPFDIFIQDYLMYIILIIGIISGITSYIILRQKKSRKNRSKWKEKKDIFFDFLNIDSFFLIHKNTSAVILEKTFSKIPHKANLISGFLQAITSFKYEIKKENIEKKVKESILLDFMEYKIYLQDGEFIRIALILNSEPSNYLKKISMKFIEEFENKHYKLLKNFNGEINIFQKSIFLIDMYYNTSLVYPHRVNRGLATIELSSFQENLLKIIKKFERKEDHFFIGKLLNYLIEKMPNQPKEKIIANIYDLKQFGLLVPIREDYESIF